MASKVQAAKIAVKLQRLAEEAGCIVPDTLFAASNIARDASPSAARGPTTGGSPTGSPGRASLSRVFPINARAASRTASSEASFFLASNKGSPAGEAHGCCGGRPNACHLACLDHTLVFSAATMAVSLSNAVVLAVALSNAVVLVVAEH